MKRHKFHRFGKMPTGDNPGEVVGVIGDIHLPYEQPDYLEFCKRTFEEQGATRVIQIGDCVDGHALSFHDSEPSLKGALGERIDAIERLQAWYDAFPELEMVMGNHDAIPARHLKKIGLDPNVYLRPISEVYRFPDGWSVHDEIISNGVKYHHGHTCLGPNGFRLDADRRGMNTVSGHAHTNFGVSYTASDARTVWGCAVGCGIDVESMAFAYQRQFKLRPVLGCAVILESGTLPVCFPMAI
jgi:metallophosphoesterase superfamily enzyme